MNLLPIQKGEFTQSNRRPNRNFRMSYDMDEGLMRAAQDHTSDGNVSEIFRQIAIEWLVDHGYLCPICRTIDCKDHSKTAATKWRRDRDRAEYNRLARLFKEEAVSAAT